MKKLRKLLIFGFILYLGVTFLGQQFTLMRLDSKYKELKAKAADVLKENDNLKKTLEEVNSDNFIEKIAREKLGLVKKGEIIYIDINKGGGEKK
ncbi:MAG: FtsB family cell division protein [Caldanaerobacter sp.]